MSVLIVASSEPRVGKSTIAAAIAYRLGRAGKAVSLARLSDDDPGDRDASVYAQLQGIATPGRPVSPDDVTALGSVADLVLEAPAGPVAQLAQRLDARIVGVALPASPPVDASGDMIAGTIVTRVPARNVAAVAQRHGVVCVVPEDRVLAAPSVDDIARTIEAQWLVQPETRDSIDRVMIGTVASDSASPYFGARDRKCVVTRYDKTDIQLAALLTDVEMLVLTGGGQPSPYLLDRITGTRDDIAVVLVKEDTVDTMRALEGLYANSRFDGNGKLLRAVELLDEAGCPVEF